MLKRPRFEKGNLVIILPGFVLYQGENQKTGIVIAESRYVNSYKVFLNEGEIHDVWIGHMIRLPIRDSDLILL